jgi:hyperosmotically inducible periplasmic protein
MRVTVLASSCLVMSLALLSACSDRSTTSTSMRTPAAPAAGSGTADRSTGGVPQNRIEREVRHELVMLPYYGVFDNLSFRVDGSTVTLMGQVTRPTLKSDAEHVVQRIEGVTRVVNNIEVLPLSPSDDRIRLATYRAIYSQPQLNRYALNAVPPIHIIVNNGKVTLQGVVANEGDKNIAGIQANQVPGVFSVQNDLQVEKGS